MADLRLRIATPERVIVDGPVTQVSLPTPLGEITVLKNHMALVSVISPGEIVYQVEGTDVSIAISTGVVEVQNNVVTVLAATAERVEEIDEQRARAAQERARQLMSKRLGEQEYAETAAVLERNLVRLRLAKKYKHRGKHGITQESVRKE